MTRRVAIVTDSTACIPPALAEDLRIEVVPVHIILGGRAYEDSMAADTAAFYDSLRTAGERPTTAAPSPGMYVQAIGRASRSAEAVLVITVSAQFSAMHDSARAALGLVRAESPSLDVRLLDSRNAAMAQGFVVLEAARAAASGADADAVVARAEEMRTRVTLVAMLDTLSFLARSGRVPRVAAWAAGMLQVKPVVRFGAGEITLAARPRTRARALARIEEIVRQRIAGRPAHIAVHHADCEQEAAALLAALERSERLVEAHLTPFTQVMGVHTGPGLVGAAWWCED